MAGDPHEPGTEHDGPQAHANSGQPDALADLLGSDVREAATIAAFDRLRADGLGVDDAVRKLVADGVLAALDAPGFALENRGLSLLPKARSRAAGKQGKAGKKANGKAAATGLSVAEADRLTSWIVEIAIDLGVNPGGDVDIRPDGSWSCRSKAGYGDGAFALIAHLRDDASAGAWASEWLVAHPGYGPFAAIDDTQDTDSASDSGRLIEMENVWNRAITATGTIAEDWLTGLGFDKKMLAAIAPDLALMRMLSSWWGGQPALVAPVSASDGSMIALHLQSLDPAKGVASGEPRNKRGRASWLKDGLIRLGNHGDGASATLHMALTLADGLALRAAGIDRVAVPPLPGYLGRAVVPNDVTLVVVVGMRSEFMQRGLARLCAQRVDVRFAELPSGSPASLLAASGAKAVADAVQANALLWQRGDDAFLDEIYRLDDNDFTLMREKLKKLKKNIPGMPAPADIASARGKARKRAAAIAKAEAEADDPAEEEEHRPGHAAPHKDPQVLEEILGDMLRIIDRYLDLPKGADTVMALYAAFTHVYQLFRFAVRLYFFSKDENTGKTTAGEMTSRASQDRYQTDNISMSSIFRLVSASSVTLFLDEVELRGDGGAEVELVIRAGYRVSGSITRSEPTPDGKNWRPVRYPVFSPLIMAANFILRRTTMSRCIVIRMEPATRFLPDMGPTAERELEVMASRFARWALDESSAVQAALTEVEEVALADDGTSPEALDRIVPRMLRGRLRNNWHSLFVIAHLAGPNWRRRVREAFAALRPAETRDMLSIGVQLLLGCRDILDADPSRTDWPAGVLQSALHKLPNAPWNEMPGTGQPITTAKLGLMLRDYGIHLTKNGKTRTWGYRRKFFETVFAKHLAADRIHDIPDDDDDIAENTSGATSGGVGGSPAGHGGDGAVPDGDEDRSADDLGEEGAGKSKTQNESEVDLFPAHNPATPDKHNEIKELGTNNPKDCGPDENEPSDWNNSENPRGRGLDAKRGTYENRNANSSPQTTSGTRIRKSKGDL